MDGRHRMNGYAPSSPRVVLELATLVVATIACGLALTRRHLPGGRIAAWVALLAAVFTAERLTREEPGGLRMLAICAALLFGFKAVVGTVHLATGAAPLSVSRWLGFALLWPGMSPAVLAGSRRADRDGAALVLRGLLRLATGSLLVLLARLAWVGTARLEVAAPLLLVGLSLALHFGLFTLSAGLWRLWGISCAVPFQAPLAAKSLSDFWAHRWNRPFSELVQLTIYRPVAALSGRATALFSGFLLSGILHEVAISVPARAGYGRPLAYFALQGALVLLEGRIGGKTSPLRGRLRTLLGFTLPLPLLLIPEFLRAAIWPLIGID